MEEAQGGNAWQKKQLTRNQKREEGPLLRQPLQNTPLDKAS